MNPNIGINFFLCIFLSPLLCSSSPQETYLYLAEPLSPLTRAKGGEFLFFLERSHIWQWISAYLPWVYIWLHCWRVSEWIVKPISSYPDEKLWSLVLFPLQGAEQPRGSLQYLPCALGGRCCICKAGGAATQPVLQVAPESPARSVTTQTPRP